MCSHSSPDRERRTVPLTRSTADSSIYAGPRWDSATSRITSRGVCSSPVASDRFYTLNYDEPGIEGVHTVDGPITADRALFAMWGQGSGAEIMGRKKFGPQSGPWPDDGWRGWWGEQPPFRTPCFVLTHHPREPMEFDNGTSFHFIGASPAEALAEATAAADGLNVRIGGGPSTVRQFLAAGLVDFLHIV